MIHQCDACFNEARRFFLWKDGRLAAYCTGCANDNEAAIRGFKTPNPGQPPFLVELTEDEFIVREIMDR